MTPKDDNSKNIHTRTNRIFLLGVTTLLPSMLTVFIMFKAYEFINTSLATPINKGLIRLIAWMREVPPESMSEFPHLVGFVIAFAIFFFTGLLFAGFVGRRLFQIIETWLSSLPVIKAVYPYAKQIVEFFTSDNRPTVSGVVFIEYPRIGTYSLAFVTGVGMKEICEKSGEEIVNVFVPSSPTPVSGYALFLPRKHVHPIDLTVDQVLRFSISAGVLVPESQR